VQGLSPPGDQPITFGKGFCANTGFPCRARSTYVYFAMNRNVISLTKLASGAAIVAAALVTAGCEAEKSRNPLSPNVAGPIAGVSISVPQPASPANGSEVLNTSPVQLTFNNSTSNGERPFWYIVELAADAGFTNRLYSNARVTPAAGSQTTVVVDGALAADRTYYWRVKAHDGANESEFSAASRFDLVVPIVLGAPVPVSPVNGETVSSVRPVLTVNNGAVQGRAGRVEYWFEVALDQAFAQTLAQVGVERSGGAQTSAQMPELPAGALLYWRATGFNGTLTGTWSQVQSFRTPAAAPPPPGPGPSPGPSPAPAPGCSAGGSPADWSYEQWRVCFMSIVAARGAGGAVSSHGMDVTRGDLVALGADWQNGWRGDYRPRIFLPVRNCPSPSTPGAPACTYSKTVDVGNYGEAWQWIVRGPT
jgi:hypothetical protein